MGVYLTLSMNTLPTELWELIVAEVEDPLSTAIPCVCKLFKNYCSDNGNVWLKKSSEKAQRYTIEGVNKKSDLQTWKQFYFSDPLCLFPLWGISIGKTTRDDIIKITEENRDLVSEIEGPAVYINGIDFWLDTDTDIITNCKVNLKTSELPEKWQLLGFNSDTTIDYAKKLFRECSQNYKESKVEFSNQTWPEISSVIIQKDGTKYYLTLSFYDYGRNDGLFKLRSIRVCNIDSNDHYEQIFQEKKCVDYSHPLHIKITF